MHERRSTIRAFYLNCGLRELIPIYPLYAIMFGEHGITPVQLSLLFSIWCAAGLVLEVPSGALADRFSRKWLVVASSVLKSLGFLCWYLRQDFDGYALGFLLWGTGGTLRSGAWQALLYDLLKQWRREGEFAALFGRARALSMLGVALGELLGGLLIVRGFDFVLLVSMAMPLVAAVPFAMYVPDAATSEGVKSTARPRFMHLVTNGIREAFADRSVLYILLVCSLLTNCWGVYDEFVSPTLKEKGFSLDLIAYTGAAIYISQASGMALAGRFGERAMRSLLIWFACGALILQGAVHLEGSAVALSIAAFGFLAGLAGTLVETHLQHAIDSGTRATVTSTVSLCQGLAGIGGFLLFGWVAQYHGMIGGTFATSLFATLLAVIFIWLNSLWFGRESAD